MNVKIVAPGVLKATVKDGLRSIQPHLTRKDDLVIAAGPFSLREGKAVLNEKEAQAIDTELNLFLGCAYQASGYETGMKRTSKKRIKKAIARMKKFRKIYSSKNATAFYMPCQDIVVVSYDCLEWRTIGDARSILKMEDSARRQRDFRLFRPVLAHELAHWNFSIADVMRQYKKFRPHRKADMAYEEVFSKDVKTIDGQAEDSGRLVKIIEDSGDDCPELMREFADFVRTHNLRDYSILDEAMAHAVEDKIRMIERDWMEPYFDEETTKEKLTLAYGWAKAYLRENGTKALLEKSIEIANEAYANEVSPIKVLRDQ